MGIGDDFVAGKLLADGFVGLSLISHHADFAGQVFADDRFQVGDANAINVEASGFSASIHEGQNDVFVGPSGATLLGVTLR